MKPQNFLDKLKKKIRIMPEEDRISIFNQDGLKILQKINQAGESGEKFATVHLVTVENKNVIKFCRYFNISVYYKRCHVTLFLTNFKGNIFSSRDDDRYRFLKACYPFCKEYRQLKKKREKFFVDQVR
mgnify:CR=1 FL=1|tara:strand:- start:57 stop:440 length:384 start_codon:yes stop_codon:yes gene_type:complete